MRELGPFRDYYTAGKTIGTEYREKIRNHIARLKPSFKKFLRTLQNEENLWGLRGKIMRAHEPFIDELMGLSDGSGVNRSEERRVGKECRL